MTTKQVIVLIGPPGSGKAGVGQHLMERYKVPHLSSGNLLRSANTSATSEMSRGALVSDKTMIDLIKRRIGHKDCARGCILDGFPRTVTQAMLLDRVLQQSKAVVSHVVHLYVPDKVLAERICGRWVHPKSGRSYHVVHHPPRSLAGHKPSPATMLDDATGDPLVQRADDTRDVLARRLAVYHAQTEPVVDHYRAAQEDADATRVVRVDAAASPTHVLCELDARMALATGPTSAEGMRAVHQLLREWADNSEQDMVRIASDDITTFAAHVLALHAIRRSFREMAERLLSADTVRTVTRAHARKQARLVASEPGYAGAIESCWQRPRMAECVRRICTRNSALHTVLACKSGGRQLSADVAPLCHAMTHVVAFVRTVFQCQKREREDTTSNATRARRSRQGPARPRQRSARPRRRSARPRRRSAR